ncbi:hypothetical protein SAMN05444483_11442 [Salegentibacter echinorum]|uniref:Uncharacterized protein n=1 Tax=Salegentibacter echinorum TaxID=1073325 RepID=A0A1M5KEC6_SALEC|nr:hypothetical protein [Salegentibacter echinorum]SHG51055.1 hypothetical protein SAMN05444483_11442 [Salegentibacter echinorum]
MKRSLQNLFFQYIRTWSLGTLFLVMACLPTQSFAQNKEYASQQDNGKNRATIVLGLISGGYNPTSGTAVANVENPNNAVDGNEATHATMIAKNVSILLVDYSGEAWLQMNYSNQVSSNTTTYIKIDQPTSTGFNLDLLETVGGLLGLLDEDILITEVYNGNNLVSSSEVHSTIARDADGNVYLAVTSSEAYSGVRIKLRSQSNLLGLSLGGGLNLKVYDAFYYSDAADCGKPAYTYYEDSGLNIGLLEFQNRNLENAVDTDLNTYSTLKQGALLSASVAGSKSQIFNFLAPSSETSTLNIKFSLGSQGLVNTDLLGSAEVIMYNGSEEIYRRSLQSSLLNNTDILNLLQSGNPVTLTFAPGKSFDRVTIRLSSPVGLSVAGSALQIYDVERYDDSAGCTNPEIAALPTSTENPFQSPSCANGLIDFDNVDFANRAVDGNNESFTTLYADSGNLLVSNPTAGFVEMDLGQNLPANKTTYVRINYDKDVLDRLLGGSLGKLVGDLANSLLLGNQFIEVEAKKGNISVLNGTSSIAFEGISNGDISLVQDNIGRYYIAITPNADYDRIRITNHVYAVLSTGKKASLDVYNACFEIGTDSCFAANFTSYRGGGVGLNVGNISNVGVKDAYKAINENSSDYSEINLGVAGIAANVYQSIYFNQPSQPNDKVKIRLAIEPSSALSLDVLGRYKIKFYKGETQVGNDETLQSGILNNIDLLTLFNSGGIVELEFEPDDTFNRVDIGAESIASVNVDTEPLRLYGVERYGDNCPLTITESPFENPACATELIDANNVDNLQNLFDADFDSFATLKSGAGSLLGINNYEGYVELGYDQVVPAGTTSYIRIDFEETILEALVSGSLGNIVTGLLDGLVLGDHFFQVEIKDENSNIINSASSNQASAGGNEAIRVVQDKQGRYYIAVTPAADYKSVRITDATNSALGLLAQPNTMNVYGMCHETNLDACSAAFATSYEYNGVNLSVNDLSGAGVTNKEQAIDDNTQNFSEISNGTLGVGSSTKQWIFFNSPSNKMDIAVIKFKTQGGGVDADVLGGLEIKAYLGNTEVAQFDFQNGIINGVNIINLLNNNQMVELSFRPGVSYDRISVGIKTLVGTSILSPINLFEVERLCGGSALITNPMIYPKVD